ncbi:MAG: D-glycero-beta-D-manno-heptose 1,7-bisphosphate 7-phosphatase [Lachnospiraceae bacterium]|nr:D-glycero-beta-D-manno-heptose 1,7-bisphosphate 7-phosphatase [Lachnospiraceae bacterium]
MNYKSYSEKVVFLDRDGTINIEKNYLYKTEDFQFVPGAPQAIARLNTSGYKVIVITNQAGVARGYYTEADVLRLNAYINHKLAAYKGHIDDFYYCPHHPIAGVGKYKIECNCRKPKIGLFLEAEEKYSIDKNKSWMIGDNKGDILAGKKYGVRTILVRTGYGSQLEKEKFRQFDLISNDLTEAVFMLLEREGDSGQAEDYSDIR